MKKLSILIVVCLSAVSAFGQIPVSPNCPPSPVSGTDFVQIFGSNTTSCNTAVLLTAVGQTSFASTDSYTVSSVPYNPFPFVGANTPQTPNFGSPAALDTKDDVWSTVIPISFPFCFFGQKYDSLLIGSNGNISFNTANSTNTNAFNFGTVTMPNNNPTFNNSICGPHSDIFPQVNTGCSITWQVYGTAPCRAFVVNWDSVDYYSPPTCTNKRTTQQIVLFENTNIIDNTIKFKQLCSANGSNSGTAHQGIQNATGTVAYTVPGHNGGQWTDSQSTWRFTPAGNGANAFNYSWTNAATGVVLGATNTISVVPFVTTDYAVKGTSGCSGISFYDTIKITVSAPTIASYIASVGLGCIDDTISFTNSSIGAINYFWDFGDNTTSILANPTHVYTTQNTYTVLFIAINGSCRDTIKRIFNLKHPIQALPNIPSLKICLDPPLKLATTIVGNLSIGGGLISTFNFSDGPIVVQNSVSNNTIHQFNAPGNYPFTLSVVDTLGCVDTFKTAIFVDGIPYSNFTVSDSNICLGEPIYLLDSTAYFAQSFIWDFGDGFTLSNIHNPQHNFNSAQPFTVSLTSNYLVCPPKIKTKIINVDNYPFVNLGKDTTYCPGFTSTSIFNFLPSVSSGASSYLWSDGSKNAFNNTINSAGTYWLKAISLAGCASTDTIFIAEDCFINIPNAFSPGSNDATNKYFMPKNNLISGATTYSLDIFNRWGERVFATTNINSKGWDGQFGLKDQPMGVYVYNISILFKNGIRKNYTGNVTLLR
jgi:gliding motility-associated-like protein